MSVYTERREELERYEFQYGATRGKLALTLDLLTDALVMVGQHGVYCTSSRNPAKPAMDLQVVLKEIEDAKDLVRDAMAGLQATQPL